jgi:hypothetical protein
METRGVMRGVKRTRETSDNSAVILEGLGVKENFTENGVY